MMYKNKSLRTPSNIILSSLAIVDLLTGATVAPLYAAQLLHSDVIKIKSVEMVRRYEYVEVIPLSQFIDKRVYFIYFKIDSRPYT